MQHPFQGSYVALPTPFREGRIDLEAFEEMIDYHAEHETAGLVVAGTTGEAPTLNEYEHRSLLHAAVDFSRGRLPVIAGVGKNCTRTSVELARFAASSGVDGVLVVTPYYNKPSPRGLLLHFGQIADAIDLPLMLYNVPSRTGIDLTVEVAAELAARHENVVAIKEASRSVERVIELVARTDLDVLCGEDSLIARFVAAGAAGAVSVMANLVPDEVAELVRCARAGGDPDRAAELDAHLAPLARDLYVEVNPVPVKAALARLCRCREEVRAPLAPLEDESRARLLATLERVGLLAPEKEPVLK